MLNDHEDWKKRGAELARAIEETVAITRIDVEERKNTLELLLKAQGHGTRTFDAIVELLSAIGRRLRSSIKKRMSRVPEDGTTQADTADTQGFVDFMKMAWSIIKIFWHTVRIVVILKPLGKELDNPEDIEYEIAQIDACDDLLRAMQSYGPALFTKFRENYDPGADGEYSRRYVLRTLLDQMSIDLNIVQAAIQQRRRKEKGVMTNQGAALSVANKVAHHALKPAIDNGFLQDTPVITHLDKNFSIRLVPYCPVLLIGVPYATMSEKREKNWEPSKPSRDFLAIPHEVGHYLYWNGKAPGTDSTKVYEHLKEQLHEKIAEKDWRWRWLEEIFADTYSCLVAGPVAALDFQERLSDNRPVHPAGHATKHPFPRLRPFIQTEILRQIDKKYEGIAGLLEHSWQEWLDDSRPGWGTEKEAEGKALSEQDLKYRLNGQKLTKDEIIAALAPVLPCILETLDKQEAHWDPWTQELSNGRRVQELYTNFQNKAFPVEPEWRKEGDILRNTPPDDVTVTDVERLLFQNWSIEGPEHDKFP